MSEAVVAKRYADALFQLAKEKGNLNEVSEQLAVVQTVFAENGRIIQVIDNPALSKDKKIELVHDAFKGAHPFVLNTLKLLTERGRLSIIDSVAGAFAHLYNEENGVAVVTVQSVRALSDAEQDNLKAIFKSKLNKQDVVIDNQIDSSVLGGIKAKVGNTIYDGTISGKLNRLRNQIVSATK